VAARASGIVVVVARAGGDEAGPRSPVALLREALRPGTHTFRFLMQGMGWTSPRVRHPEQADRWSWLVVAAYMQLRLARPCCGLEAALGETLRHRSTDTGAGPSGSFVAFGGVGSEPEGEGAQALR
jgi:hypothetical protein